MEDFNAETLRPLSSWNDFLKKFNEEIRPSLFELEKEREAAKARWQRSIPIIAGLGFIAALIVVLAQWPPVIILVILAVGGLAAFGYRSSCFAPFRASYKSMVVRRIVEAVHPNLTYAPSQGISLGEFHASGIFNHQVDRYNTEDEVRGRIGATELRCAEVHAEYKTVTHDSKGRRREQWHTLFKGFFVLADFHKDFKGHLAVLPDTAESMLGGFGRWMQSINMSRNDLVRMDDPEFEKEFVVYGTDQVEARYILSNSMMQRILEVRRRAGTPIHIAFTQSVMCLAIPRQRDAFEAETGRSLLEPETHRDNVEDLMFISGLVDDLNLNTRIWSKT